MKRNAQIAVRIPAKYKSQLKQWAKDENCSVSDIINNLVFNRIRREKRHKAKEVNNSEAK